jgi:flagellar hook-basal body complex protein FliE
MTLPIGAIGSSPLSGLQSVGATAPTAPTNPAGVAGEVGGTSFGDMLSSKLGEVTNLQDQANQAAQAVASGQSDDLAGASIAVEKASIAIELTGAIRNKALEAYQDVMRMQV